jgi:PiT family inorganic phosphate transporter
MQVPIIAVVLIFIALSFEFINGFHDTANAVATSISTKSLEPFQAIAISALFNLLGALSGTAVAVTIAEGFADPNLATNGVILSALLSAITWNLITWTFGIPSSSSHTLIGGLIGAIGFECGFNKINLYSLLHKVLLPMVISPLSGFIVASFIAIILTKLLLKGKFNPRNVNNNIRELQVISTAFLSFSHGAGDSQKTMGIITLVLFNMNLINTIKVPQWVIIVCACCMAMGTLSGGVRVIKTLSTRVAKLTPASGFAAEITSASILFIGAKLGMPLSTTHAVSGSIMGAGATGKFGINISILKNMIIAWTLTIPVSIIISGLYLHIIRAFFLIN